MFISYSFISLSFAPFCLSHESFPPVHSLWFFTSSLSFSPSLLTSFSALLISLLLLSLFYTISFLFPVSSPLLFVIPSYPLFSLTSCPHISHSSYLIQTLQEKGLASLSLHKAGGKKKGYTVTSQTSSGSLSGPLPRPECFGKLARASLVVAEMLLTHAAHSMHLEDHQVWDLLWFGWWGSRDCVGHLLIFVCH